MAEPTMIERGEQAVSRAWARMMHNLTVDNAKVAKRNFKDWKKRQDELEFARFQKKAQAEAEAEEAKRRELVRLRDARESARAKIMEARPLADKIEKIVETLGVTYEQLLDVTDSAYQAAPAAYKPRVGDAILKNGRLEAALLVALQKAGIPVPKETDARLVIPPLVDLPRLEILINSLFR